MHCWPGTFRSELFPVVASRAPLEHGIEQSQNKITDTSGSQSPATEMASRQHVVSVGGWLALVACLPILRTPLQIQPTRLHRSVRRTAEALATDISEQRCHRRQARLRRRRRVVSDGARAGARQRASATISPEHLTPFSSDARCGRLFGRCFVQSSIRLCGVVSQQTYTSQAA